MHNQETERDIQHIIEQIIQKPTNKLIESLEKNGFRVNVTKTQCIFFDANENQELHINGERIKGLDTAKYLGITVDKNLTFKQHIKSLRDKGLKALRTLSYMSGTKGD